MIRYEKQIFIRYGTIYGYKSAYPLVRVREIRRHRHFMLFDDEMINDIAILILDQNILPTKYVGYAKLPLFDFNNQRTMTVYGSSGVDLNEPCSPILRKTEMIIRPT